MLEQGEWIFEAKDPNIIVDRKISLVERGPLNFLYEATKTGSYESFFIFKDKKLVLFKSKLNISTLKCLKLLSMI